jgi:glycosyltransferase involved in cell wall biosynthesis
MLGASGRVLCVVPHAQESELDDAKKSGAVLVSLGLDRSNLPDFFDPGWLGTAVKKLAEAGASTVDWCIGHDAITGAAANAMKRDKAANASAVICHMSYADYQGVKHPEYPDIESKIREQRQILKAADAVIAVGPLLSNRAFDVVDRPVPMLVPGLPSIKPRPARKQFEAISFGRFERTNDRIKQIQLAAEGLAEARRRAGEPGGPRVLRDNPTLKLIGVSWNDAESLSLRQVMQTRAKQIVNLRSMPYQEDRQELYEEIAGSSAALMLSWHEGFGLTGWEAIAAEVPLIVSEQSGLYELLYTRGLHGFVRSLRVDGSYCGDGETPNFTDEDRRRVADHILEVAHEPDVARGMARNLKESLIAQGCTWPNAAQAVLQALAITSPAPVKPPPEPVGRTEE